MDYQRVLEVDRPFEQAVPAVKAALAEQGFGVLTEIDMTATLKAKRGVDIEPYVILGACNPAFAEAGLAVDRSIGVFLPCNVVVSAREGGGAVIRIFEPTLMPVVTGMAVLEPLAADVARRLQAALDAVAAG